MSSLLNNVNKYCIFPSATTSQDGVWGLLEPMYNARDDNKDLCKMKVGMTDEAVIPGFSLFQELGLNQGSTLTMYYTRMSNTEAQQPIMIPSQRFLKSNSKQKVQETNILQVQEGKQLQSKRNRSETNEDC